MEEASFAEEDENADSWGHRNNLLVKGQYYIGLLLVFPFICNFSKATLVRVDQ